jgi:hypothetical protein
LLTAAWYGRPKAIGLPTWLRGYLVTGTALLAVTVALPLAGLTTPVGTYSPVTDWLDVLWQRGTFAQLAIAVTLGILARALRSRTLVVIAAVYAVLVCLAGWIELQQVPVNTSGSALTDPYVVLAAVLLLAGLGALLAAAVSSRSAGPPGTRAGDDVRPAGT